MGARTTIGLTFVLSVNALAVIVAIRRGVTFGDTVRIVAALSALLSLVGSGLAMIVAGRPEWRSHPSGMTARSMKAGRLVALHAAIVASTTLAIVLAMRLVRVIVDLLNAFPGTEIQDYGYGPNGLWCLALLFVSCGISLVTVRETRLFTCQYVIIVSSTVWACLLAPVYKVTPSGGLEQTGTALALPLCLSILLVLGVLTNRGMERRRHPNAAQVHDSERTWPGFRTTCGIIAVAVILLTSYHLIVPVPPRWGGFRLVAVVAAVSAVTAAPACFLLAIRAGSGHFADAGMALSSLAFGGGALLLLPSRPISLTERYPMVFSALMVALALGVAGCTWLATYPRRRSAAIPPAEIAARLVPHAKRFAFLNAVLALVAGGLMAVWPRLRSVAVSDASVGRVAAGFGANLFLLLVMLWCARRLKRLTFHILTILVLVSAAGFMLMRMFPFTSRFG